MRAREKLSRLRALLWLASLFLVLGVAVPIASGKGEEATNAAKALRQWQFAEAREKITAYASKHPDTATSKYLLAELAFLDGDYAGAVGHLANMSDSQIDGNVGELRALASSSFDATKGFVSIDSSGGHFKILFDNGKDRVIAELAAEVLEQAYEKLGDDLGHRPSQQIRVELLGRAADLAKVSTLTVGEIETTGTIALCKYGKLMVVSPRATLFGYPWMDTLTHEYVHYLVTQISHDRVPVWLHEGLARYLQVRWRGPATGSLTALDETLLAKALKKNSLVTFEEMHPSMAKLPSAEAAALAFAEVSTMVGYLHRTMGEAGLRRMLGRIRDGEDARKAVGGAMKMSWNAVEAGWMRSLREAKLQVASDGAAGHKIRFRKGDGDAGNVGLEDISNPKAKKFTRLGGMLRAARKPHAAAVEYEKAFAITPNSTIRGKLGSVYLEIGRYERAIEMAEPLVGQSEMDSEAAITVGMAKLALGDARGATKALELALRINPFNPQVRCGLAEGYAASGHKDASRERQACEYLQQVR